MTEPREDIHPLFHGAPGSGEFRKLRKRIVRQTREAVEQYGMVEPGGSEPQAGKNPNGSSACRAARTATPCSRCCTS